MCGTEHLYKKIVEVLKTASTVFFYEKNTIIKIIQGGYNATGQIERIIN